MPPVRTRALRVSRRSTLNVAVSGGAQKLLDDNYDTNSLSYGGGYSYSVTRYASLRVGYRVQTTDYSSVWDCAANTGTHSDRSTPGSTTRGPLSISRRTTVSFGTGSSAIDNGRETFYIDYRKCDAPSPNRPDMGDERRVCARSHGRRGFFRAVLRRCGAMRLCEGVSRTGSRC